MIRIYLAVMALSILYSCQRKISGSFSTQHNITSFTEPGGEIVLLGVHKKEELEQSPFNDWFNKNYADYSPDSLTIQQLKPLLKNKYFEIFMGTWCGDSRREVPRMFKLLEQAGVHASQIKLIMVDNRDSTYKQSPTHEERSKNIHHVPDLLVYENNKELNRIVEYPDVSLEKDLLSIVQYKTYIPSYKAAALLIDLLKNKSPQNLLQEKNSITDSLKRLTENSNELNTLGFVWMQAGEYEKARTAFLFNSFLYPDNVKAYNRLGELSMKLNNKDEAKAYYQKVLQLDPGDANAIQQMQLLKSK